MTPATVYFVTALVLTTHTPPLGWVQYYHKSYSLLEVCYEHVISKREAIILSLHSYLGDNLIEVYDIQCMTYDKTVRENTKLSH